MEDTEKSAISTASPPRVVIAEADGRGRGDRRVVGRERNHSRSSHHSADEITPISNSATVPIEYRTL
jgi:hypothetical protein